MFLKKIEEKLLIGKLEEEENNLILQMRKDFIILQKQTNIHEREIKRIQTLVTKYAIARGLFQGELKREKTRAKQQNDIMAVSKNVVAMNTCYSPKIQETGKNGPIEKNKQLLKNPPPTSPLMKMCKLFFFFCLFMRI